MNSIAIRIEPIDRRPGRRENIDLGAVENLDMICCIHIHPPPLLLYPHLGHSFPFILLFLLVQNFF